ncbi:MAG: CDP-alcohol phosphatidyltransferase family protein [Candidatus Jorgensenbacteria bacterium]|nr:CDP-alcohol phosphatidyltransferase family protein [Candidatus Jorgensenbacteria bacterium]
MTALNQFESTLNAADGLLERVLRRAITAVHTVKRKRENAVERFRASEARLLEKILDTTFLKEELFATANLWSFSRAFLGVVLYVFIVYEVPFLLIFPVLVFAVLTDRIDGTYSRMEGETVLGEIIDPTCDKVFAIMLFLAFEPVIWGSVFLLLLVVEFTLGLGPFFVIFSKKIKLVPSDASAKSNRWGKFKFFVECTALPLLLIAGVVAPEILEMIANILLAVAILFGIMSGLRKVTDVFHMPRVV